MPGHPKRYYGSDDLHFVTFSCSQRLPLLGSAERRDLFLQSLEATRKDYKFMMVGYVVMPEHVHLLVDEPRERNLSVAIKALKQGMSRRVLQSLKAQGKRSSESCPFRFWTSRFYDFNVWTGKKRIEN